MAQNSISRTVFLGSRFALLFLGGLAFTRILYELFFPHLLWLGRPFPALSISLLFALITNWLTRRITPSSIYSLTFSPLLLNLLYLFDPAVDLGRSRLIFAASIWLTAVLMINIEQVAGNQKLHDKWLGKNILLLLAALLPVYFLTMPMTVGRADSFEFQVVAPQLGIAHPTGYPLYLLLGKLFTLIPVGSVAWRLNAGTAVFALTAATLLYLTGRKLLGHPLPALLGAVAFGLTPTFWSQAIEAEVYSLHALIIAAALYVFQVTSSKWQIASEQRQFTIHNSLFIIHYSLFLLIGLGLTNHLTTVFLIPPALLTLFFTFQIQPSSFRFQHLLKLALAFLAPLSLYAYLPLRWSAVNGEPMGFGRFVDWIIGGRFQDALQWRAWLNDLTRYEIVGRLFLDNWGWFNLTIVLIGLIYLFIKQQRMALILLITWLGYTFYNLNYYVPDLAVFLIPAQIVVAIWWMAGVTAVLKIKNWGLGTGDWKLSPIGIQSLVSSLILIPILLLAVQKWPQIDRSQDDGLTEWGQGVLAMPLAENAAILADSEKIAPLYYLQQAESIRSDLEIMVLPDEAAYRAELDSRVTAGQTVYLARFLPGLESIYHLRSMGPLTEVSTQPMTELPDTAVPTNLNFNNIQLIGYELEPQASVDETSTAVTLYWQTNNQQPTTSNQLIYIRWAKDNSFTSQHPANNYYPTLAWDSGEIVSDFHLLSRPFLNESQDFELQVAWGKLFASSDELDWQTVTTVPLPPTTRLTDAQPYRAQIGDFSLTSAQFPTQIRPQQNLSVTLEGYGIPFVGVGLLQELREFSGNYFLGGHWFTRSNQHYIISRELDTDLENGRYYLIVSPRGDISNCGWFSSSVQGCILGEIEISGMPLPTDATNYEDKIALLNIDLPQTELQPGGQLPVTLTWQSLSPINEDYTVFIQILDANDRIVGQVDAWPRQGTLPTSQWTPGETINDPYLIQLASNLPPGQYRLIVGWYLLADLRRLPVLDENGQPFSDKLLVPGLVAP